MGRSYLRRPEPTSDVTPRAPPAPLLLKALALATLALAAQGRDLHGSMSDKPRALTGSELAAHTGSDSLVLPRTRRLAEQTHEGAGGAAPALGSPAEQFLNEKDAMSLAAGLRGRGRVALRVRMSRQLTRQDNAGDNGRDGSGHATAEEERGDPEDSARATTEAAPREDRANEGEDEGVPDGQRVQCPGTDTSIPINWLCDGDDDCGTGWDESPSAWCNSTFDCSATGRIDCPGGPVNGTKKCLFSEGSICDGIAKCPGGTDEINCTDTWGGDSWSSSGIERVQCPGTNVTIPINWLCDGGDDCGTGWDEDPEVWCNTNFDCSATGRINCPGGPVNGTKKCLYGIGNICDGTPMCPGGTDELNCKDYYESYSDGSDSDASTGFGDGSNSDGNSSDGSSSSSSSSSSNDGTDGGRSDDGTNTEG